MKRFSLWCWRKVEEPIINMIVLTIMLAVVVVPITVVAWGSFHLAVLAGASKLGAMTTASALGGVTYFVMTTLSDRFLEPLIRPIGMAYVEAPHPDACPCDACESYRRCWDPSIADEAISNLRTERRLARAQRRIPRSRG